MAMIAAPAMTIEEYLNGPVPDPDVEFINGVLREKPLMMRIHTRLQAILCAWFENHAEEWGVVPSPELRTQITATNVLLPDIVVSAAGYASEIQVDPPLIVVEILSPSDSFTELLEKLRGYDGMGIPNIWVIDPQTRRAWVSAGAVLTETQRFSVSGSSIYLDMQETYARYDKFR